MAIPTSRLTLVTFSDGLAVPLRGRRAYLVAWLVESGGYLDSPEYDIGRLELNWTDGKLTAAATRFDRVTLKGPEL